MNNIDRLVKDIKKIKIQGATNVALKTLEGIKIKAKEFKRNDHVFSKLYQIGRDLAFARPTEPMAQNALKFVFQRKEENADYYFKKSVEYEILIKTEKSRIIKFGQEIIKNGGVYLTHCHSSSVTSIFLQAFKSGKHFSVIATETRPLFQGRTTIKDLINGGIKDVTMVIDTVAISYLLNKVHKIDGVFVGADLLSSNGFINKVGSLAISFAANAQKIPLYCISSLLKFSNREIKNICLEQRDKTEVWANSPLTLKISSPAFDFIPYELGGQLICEDGKIGFDKVVEKAFMLYPFIEN